MRKTGLKKVWALLLCLAFCVSMLPTAAVAATSTFAVLEIPIYKTVELAGAAVPGQASFEVELSDFGADTTYYVKGNSVQTNGAGDFEGKLVIEVPTENDFWNLSEGFKVTEKNTGLSGWTYDTTEWYIVPNILTNDTATGTTKEIYFGVYNLTEEEIVDSSGLNSIHPGPYFINTYMGEQVIGNDPSSTDPTVPESSISIPYTKTVSAKPGVAVPPQDFVLELGEMRQEILEDLEVAGNIIHTTGAGDYDGVLTITPKTEEAKENLTRGFSVYESATGDNNWKFDNAEWLIHPLFTEDGTVSVQITKDNDEVSADGTAILYDKITFVNEYTKETTDEDDPERNQLTIRIPVTKTVVQRGNKAAPETDFIFEIDGDDLPGELPVQEDYIATNGKGSYQGTIVIGPLSGDQFAALANGFTVSEMREKREGWEYDKTVWRIYPAVDGDKVIVSCYNETNGETKTTARGAEGIGFTNVYTAFESPEDPDDPQSEGPVILTYDPNGGTAYDTEESYEKGTVVTLDKSAIRDGFTFTGWYMNEDATEQLESVTLDRDTTVYAGWKVTPVPELLDGTDHISYVVGYEDGTVRPQGNITRAEVTMIFYRLLKSEIRDKYNTTINAFTDVTDDKWYNEAVSTMARIGIIKGRSDTVFDPEAPITRAEYSAICARFDESVTEGKSDFTDISGHWAEDDIKRAASLGWVMGYEDKTFRPDNKITRAESMTLVNRVLQRIPDEITDLLPGMKIFSDNADPMAWYYIPVQEATNGHTYERKSNGHEKWVALQ